MRILSLYTRAHFLLLLSSYPLQWIFFLVRVNRCVYPVKSCIVENFHAERFVKWTFHSHAPNWCPAPLILLKVRFLGNRIVEIPHTLPLSSVRRRRFFRGWKIFRVFSSSPSSKTTYWRSGRSTTTAHLEKCSFHSLVSILVNYRYEALEKLQLIKSEAHIDAKNVA